MKRILILLSILTLGVSKAQIVGGFIPINSTKSFTAGNSTFSNVIARGTLSVGSTATVGTLYSAGTIRSASGTSSLTGLNNNGNLITSTFESTSTGYMDSKLRVGSVVAPSATLDVTGTMSVSSTATLQNNSVLGTAQLTGGNTGTVAVLSDVPFIMPLFAAVIGGGSSPADGTSYYIGYSGGWSGAATNASVTVPYNCTLRQAEVHAFVNGTVGSAESVTLAIQGTTNYTITSTMTYSLGGENRVVSTGISQDFSAGDVIYLRQFSPTWATNPTQVAIGVLLTFTRRP